MIRALRGLDVGNTIALAVVVVVLLATILTAGQLQATNAMARSADCIDYACDGDDGCAKHGCGACGKTFRCKEKV